MYLSRYACTDMPQIYSRGRYTNNGKNSDGRSPAEEQSQKPPVDAGTKGARLMVDTGWRSHRCRTGAYMIGSEAASIP